MRSGPQHYAVYTGVLALSINVPQSGRHSNVQHSTAVMDLLLKPSRCVRFQVNSDHDPSRSNTHPLAHRREEVSHNIRPISVKECGLNITKQRNKKDLSHTQRDNKVFIHYPQWFKDIKTNEPHNLSSEVLIFTIKQDQPLLSLM